MPIYLQKGIHRILIESNNNFENKSSMMKILWAFGNNEYEVIPVDLLTPMPDKMFKVKP